MFLYIAIHKDENTGYGVTVPSLPGCFSYGDTLEKAIEESKQAILFHIEGLLEDGIEPETNQPDLATLIDTPEYAGAQWFGIEVNIDQFICPVAAAIPHLSIVSLRVSKDGKKWADTSKEVSNVISFYPPFAIFSPRILVIYGE